MSRSSSRRRKAPRSGLVALFALVASACGTGPDDLELAGTWSGAALLPTAVTANMSLTQSGVTVGGTMQIAGLLDQAFVGTLDAGARTVVWQIFNGCELWSGTFTATSDGSQMSGPIQADLSGCASGSDIDGTISVSKQ